MQPPIPVSPLAWWLLQLALSALLIRWVWRVLKGASATVLTVAAALWLYWTVPGAPQAAREFWARNGPKILRALTEAGDRIVQGLIRLMGGGS